MAADYGYKDDWLIEKIILAVDADTYRGKSAEEILQVVYIYMMVTLKAIKPIREENRDLLTYFLIEIHLTKPHS